MLIRDRRAEIVELAEYGHESAEWIRHPRTIPMVVRIHGPASRLGGRRVRWRPWNWLRYRRAFCEYDGVRSADAVSCPSASMAQLVRIDGRLDTLPIEIIPNAVVSDAWEQTQEDDRPVLARRPNALSGSTSPASATAAEPCGTTCEQIMLNPRRKTLFTAGTVVPAKGMLELVQAVELLRGRGHDLRLNIAGKWGALGRSLHRRYGCRTDQPAWLTLLGHVPREQLRTLYRTSDLVCFPSWWENCPCTCLEAMSSGGLVLGSTSGGMSEIIRDGHDGFLVHPRNPQALALRIEQVLELNREDQDRVRRNARRRIRESYDVDVIVPKMLAFYEQVIRNCWNQRVQARSYA
jgi:glycosyltransferase involved in cell wall biosynthesis